MQIRQRIIITLLILCGVWLVAITTNTVPQHIATARTGVHQYPPPADRPPLKSSPDRNPTSPPPPDPTSPPDPGATSAPPPPLSNVSGSSKSRRYTTPLPEARITGTIIDQYTGVPVQGVQVRVGSEIVVSDEYGNYERNKLAAGIYSVELLLDDENGVPLQEPALVTVVGNTTVIRHLFYTSDPMIIQSIGATEPMTLPQPIEERASPSKPTEPAPTPTSTPLVQEVPVIVAD